ncbi:penicillin-binding protein 1A [Limnobacter thiooxidans]|uniref:Penicillin-binding protein 1A n=1 Tax=Limnobacter thiooxidans TaxID=131080 RepID=A0AA86JHM7_9BURK|nr:penicillin-binding protein 1A [Limnobacter thiooxidans]BET27291.1 penicillin-binding protein 1A [Limnobacter thiooxidans]
MGQFGCVGRYNVTYSNTVSIQRPVNSNKPRIKQHPQGFIATVLALLIGLGISGALLVGVALALIFPKLPDLDTLTDYRPKVPLRVMTTDGVLIGEFGEERRRPVDITEVPLVMQQAILAAEDDRFYQHGGIDFMGVARALVTNVTSGGRTQGASTITMQVARNFFLTRDKTWTRKLYEVLLAYKIEDNLTKDEILELYINQIYLGQRAYGFQAASQVYFGKPLRDINAAEAAMLAGLPKAPSAFNPIVNPNRAKIRQEYVLRRMNDLDYLDDTQFEQALKTELVYRNRKANGDDVEATTGLTINADYAAEMARQAAVEMYGEEAYTSGITVTTTLIAKEQRAAQRALRNSVMDYELRQYFRGPEGYIELPSDAKEAEAVIGDNISDYTDYGFLQSAVVLSASPTEVVVSQGAGQPIRLTGDSLKPALSWLNERAPANKRLKRGAVVRILKRKDQPLMLTQLPEVEAAFIAITPKDGAIRALSGGFEFSRNKFNHVTQATRQPGSAFKPFVYSAALEKGVTPTTLVADEPIFVPADTPGGKDWSPKNYDGKYDGPMLLKEGLAKSKNMVSIRVLQEITPQYGQRWATQFGFPAANVPPYLTMALGAVTTNPLQMASAYAVFANSGYRIKPYLIEKITDGSGRIVARARPAVAGEEANRVIDARNAFLTTRLLREVVERGTATRAKVLNRGDIVGKTGTTNDSHDAWFAGYNSDIAAIAWVGYDQPRNLGARETGGGLALPIWIDYMRVALADLPEKPQVVPAGIDFVDGNYYYTEYRPGSGVARIDVNGGGDDINSLFNFLQGLGGMLKGDGQAPPVNNNPTAGDGTTYEQPARPKNPPKDDIERLFGN